MNKSYISILSLIVLIMLAISAVNAAEIDGTSESDILSVEETNIMDSFDAADVITSTDDVKVLSVDENGNFTEFQDSISSSDVVQMTKDYVRAEGENDISISKDVTILGNDHKIDAKNLGGIFNVNSGCTLTLKGVTLINGNAENGGAIYNDGGSLIIENSYFFDNTAEKSGGAIYNKNGSLTVINSKFDGNNLIKRSTNGWGGAAIYDKEGTVSISSSTISNNLKDIVHRGGTGEYTGDLSSAAVTSQSGVLSVKDSYFENNSGSYGGAILSNGAKANLTVSGSTFINNFAFNGGAIDFAGNTYTIKNSTFKGNKARGTGSAKTNYAHGGAICAQEINSDSLISECIFEDNSAVMGGAISSSNTKVYNCTFTKNTAQAEYSETFNGITNKRGGYGAAIYNSASMTITESTFVDNINTRGAVYVKNAEITDSAFINSVISVNKALTISNNSYDNEGVDISGSNFPEIYFDGVGEIPNVKSAKLYYDAFNFSDLKALIDSGSTSTIYLTGDITKLPNEEEEFADGILIERQISINANGHTITVNDGKVFTITETGSLSLSNGNIVADGTNAIVNNGKVTLSSIIFSNVGEYAIDNNGKVTQTSLTNFTQLNNLIALVNGGEIYIGSSKITKKDDEKETFKNGIIIKDDITLSGYSNSKGVILTYIDADNDGRIFSVNDDATFTINTIILKNGNSEKGGAIYVETGNNLIANNINFINNTAVYRGGAIYSEGSVNVVDSVFDSNDITFRAENDDNGGAAIYNYGGTLYLDNVQVTNNLKDIVVRDGNSGHLINAAIFTSGDATIKNSYIANNTGSYGAGVYVTNGATLSVSNTVFEGNNATFGACIYGEGAELIVDNCTFNDNLAIGVGSAGTADTQAAAILVMGDGSSANIINSKFNRNSAKIGGAISFAGVAIDSIIENCTFNDNIANDGGAVYIWTKADGAVTVANSTFSGNTANWGNAISTDGTLKLSNNTISKTNANIGNYAGTITSQVYVTLIGGQNINASLGDVVIPNATLTDDNGNQIRDSTFKITVDGQELETSFADGLYTATYTIKTAGDKVVSTSYVGATVTEGKYIVPKANVTEFTVTVEDIIDGENANVLVTLTGINDSGLTADVKLILNNTEYAITVIDGKGNKTVEGLAHGQYPVVAMLNENTNYNNAINSTVFYVKATTAITIVGTEEDVVYGESATIKVTVTTSDEVPFSGLVYLTYYGTEFSVVIDEGEGSYTFDANTQLLSKGEQEFIAVFDGDNDYNASESNTIKFNVIAKDINEDVYISIYGDAPDNVTVYIEGPEGTYNVTIDGTVYQVDVGEDGYGSIEIDDLSVGDKEATIAIDDDNYKGTKTETFTYKYVPDFSVVITGTYPTAEITIEGTDGTYVVYIDEEHQTEITVKDGTGRGNISGVAAGIYEDENESYVYFDATDDYNYVYDYVSFEIAQATPAIKVEAVEVTYPAPVVVTVTSNVAGTYTVKVGDKSEEVVLEANVAKDVTFEGLNANEEVYAIEVTYEETENYTAAVNDTETVKVNKAVVVFDATVATPVVYPNDVIVTVNTTVAGKVTITLDKDYVFDVAAGVTDLTISGLAVGTYSEKTVHFEADNYAPVNKDITFEVTKGTPAINVDVVVGKDTYPGTVVVIVTSDVDGTYNIAVGTQTIPITVTKGVGYTTFTNVAAGTQNATVTFVEDDIYKEVSVDKEFTINNAVPEFTVEFAEATYPEPVQVTIKGTDGTYHILGTTITVSDGKGTGSVEGLAAGTYTDVKVTFDAAGDYAASETNVSFTVKQKSSEVTVTPVTETIALPGEVNITYSASEKATIAVKDANGNSVDFTPADGKIALTNLAAGTYTVTVTIADSQNIIGSSDSITFTVTKATMDPKVSVPEKLQKDENFTVTAEDYYGDVVVEINGNKYALNENISLPEGTYKVNVIFEGNENYTGVTVEKTINVTKKSAGENPLNITVPENTTSPTFSIELPENATGYLLVDVDGEQYYAPIVNGSASITTVPLAGGNHTATVTYTGDENYAGFTNTTQISVESNITADSALDIPTSSETSSPTFSVNLPSDATGYLVVDVDGKKYAAVVENGTASVTVPGLSEGNHNVTVSYSGDSKYPALSKDAAVNVHIPVYKLSNNKNVNVVYSAKATYKVLITKDGKAVGAGESVSIKYNGKTYTVKTDAKGYATLKLKTNIKVKKYTITATYKGKTVKNTVKVKHLIKAKNIKIKKSKKVNKIKVKTNKVNGKFLKGKKLTLKIKGKKVKAIINKKGVATFKLKKKVTKKLKAGKKYKFTVSYGKDKVTKKAKVKK